MKKQVRSHEERLMRHRVTLSVGFEVDGRSVILRADRLHNHRYHGKRTQPPAPFWLKPGHSLVCAMLPVMLRNDYISNQWNTAEGDMKTSTTFLVPIFLMVVTSCGPTTDTVVAPFELTSDFTSSTSPGNSALTSPAKARQRLERFVAYAYDSVSSDIAQGHGEYLHSLTVLAGVPTDAQASFQAEMQDRYATIYNLGLSRKDTTALIVARAWSAGYGRTNWHNSPKTNGS